MNLIENLKASSYQHFTELSEDLAYSDNIEIDLLHKGYMQRCYKDINFKLRERSLNESDRCLFSLIENTLNKTLEKLERYPNQIVLRDEARSIESGCEKEVFNWFRNNLNKIICFPASTSCYSEPSRLPSGSSLIFKIETSASSRAYNLKEIQPNHPEGEILFKTRSCFRIVEIVESDNTVRLKEVDDVKGLVVFNNELYHD